MDRAALLTADQARAHLTRLLQAGGASLVSQYYDGLRATLFSGRSEVRPSMLRAVAAAELNTLLDFFAEPLPAKAAARGAQLAETGFSDQAVVQLSRTTRGYLLARLDPALLVAGIEQVVAFYEEVLQSFLRSREHIIFGEQERIRGALQRTLSRYTIQMEVAAGVAEATTSILDLTSLLQTAVELIRERFELYSVSIFLVERGSGEAILRAGTDAAGGQLPAQSTRLAIGGGSLTGACIASGEAQVAVEVANADVRRANALLPDTNSAAAIPLISRGSAIGALTVQSQRVAAISELDVTVLRLLGNQLANAITNARLFSELGRSEEKYRTVLENIEEGYYEMDAAGVFTFVNDALTSMLGFERDQLLGSRYEQFVDPDDLERVRQALAEVHATGRAARAIEFRAPGPDKTGRVIETSASLVQDTAGKGGALRGLMRDVTRRKQAEWLLIERKALERSNRELEQFAFVASHDLQEPLRKILTFGDRLQTRYAGQLSSEGQDYLQRMLTAAGRMHNLINDLLTLSRVTTQAQPFSQVDLAQVAAEVASDLEALTDYTHGRVEVGELPTIDADPLQMRQLLQNLIGNGLKFHRPDQPPLVSVSGRLVAERAAASARGGELSCQIRVVDSGIGFDPKYLTRIFQPFQRLHGRSEYEGTGIGLAICQRIVDRHGGKITAISARDAGAEFIVTLPARQQAAGELP